MSWSSTAQMPMKPVGWWVNPTGPRDALRTTWEKAPSWAIASIMAASAILLSPAVVSEKHVSPNVCAAQAHSLAPSLSSTAALTAPIKNVNAQTVSPTVVAVRNMSITAPVTAVNATAFAPTVSATVAITSGIRAANATMSVPSSVASTRNVDISVASHWFDVTVMHGTASVVAEKNVAATISRAETFMWLMVTVVAQKQVSAPIATANATMPAPTVVTEKVVTAPISAANALSFAYSYFGDGPTVAYTANCSVTAPISRANASVATPTNVVAQKQVSPPIAAAQATLPAPTVSQLSPLVVLAMRANTQMPKPTVVYGALYGFAASTVFNIPNQFAYFGIWGVGGGNGGTGGGASYVSGGGGAAGSWNGSTWERDVTLDITVRQLNINVGGGGAGGGCNLVPGNPGGNTSVTHQFGTMFIASGGNANAGWNDWTGRGVGNIDLYGYSIGGGYGNGGNGGAGGLFGCAAGGNPGVGGGVWVYAFTKPDWVPPIWTVIPNANATSPAPTVVATKNVSVSAPIATANATSPAPGVSQAVPLTFDNVSSATDNYTAASYSWSHTATAGATAYVIVNHYYYVASITSVTYDGTPMTLIGSINYYSPYGAMYLYKLANVPGGAKTVAVNSSATVYSSAICITVNNVTTTGTPVATTVVGQTDSRSLTCPAGGLVMQAFGGLQSYPVTPTGGTLRANIKTASNFFGTCASTASATTTFGVTMSISEYVGGIGVVLS